ncbi:helix-turn-helix transcriptional regulator [Alicyclobacillus acidoterrestris]|uniref:helix-turn-helix transcriptional regulator n=1 Tax=Alicyclobacillus acidoterrestris TaxID=1450 RepID=UPI003F53E2E7
MLKHKTTLKEALRERGLKQDWVASQVGLNKDTMSRLVNGKHIPNLRTAQKIARVLGTTVDELWPLEDGTE